MTLSDEPTLRPGAMPPSGIMVAARIGSSGRRSRVPWSRGHESAAGTVAVEVPVGDHHSITLAPDAGGGWTAHLYGEVHGVWRVVLALTGDRQMASSVVDCSATRIREFVIEDELDLTAVRGVGVLPA